MKLTPLLRVLQASACLVALASCTTTSQPTTSGILTTTAPAVATSDPLKICWGDFDKCQVDIPTSCDYCTYVDKTTTTTPGYTITETPCPTSTKFVRAAGGLNPSEADWLSTRLPNAVKGMSKYFASAGTQYDIAPLLKDKPPRIGLAFSGGGYRAMLGGAGVLQAFDSAANGGLPGFAGILDSSLYITGLSGGGWLVGSWALNDYPDIKKLNETWKLPSGDNDSLWDQWYGEHFFGSQPVCYGVQCEVYQKHHSGAPISFADAWSRLIARNILRTVNGDSRWSDLLSSQKHKSGQVPLPILVATGRTNGDAYQPEGPIFELSPFEFGAWDPLSIGAFVPMDKLGTRLDNGSSNGTCVRGLDNSAFIMGTSSLAITSVLTDDFGFTVQESAANIPNPFCGFGTGKQTECQKFKKFETLYLSDGGDSGQNIPLLPHLEPSREMDVIIAVDQSADQTDLFGICCGYNYPLAESLNWTLSYAKSAAGIAQGINVPNSLPTPGEVLDNLGLVYTPTFFGCDASDSTLPLCTPESESDVPCARAPAPLIVYLPNAPYVAYSNGTTSSTIGWPWGGGLTTNLINNGVALASTGNTSTSSTLPSWSVCLACALAERARTRAGIKERSTPCKACFKQYCAETKPKLPKSSLTNAVTGYYQPPPIANKVGPPAQVRKDTFCFIYPNRVLSSCNHNCKSENPLGCTPWGDDIHQPPPAHGEAFLVPEEEEEEEEEEVIAVWESERGEL